MPVLRYFVIVGAVLTAALFAASAYLESRTSTAAARVSVAPTTASLYIPPARLQPVSAVSDTSASLDLAPAAAKPPVKKARH
jgi:hypothetical protein